MPKCRRTREVEREGKGGVGGGWVKKKGVRVAVK